MCNIDLSFFKDKRVLITGHTGFKGSWLCRILSMLGAKVFGYGLHPSTSPSLYSLSICDKDIESFIGDVRDFKNLKLFFENAEPEIVIHLAAQALVRESYKNPLYTFETNVLGTVNILECIRNTHCVRSFLNVTTDKVYKNNEWCWGYRENEQLDGFDPYSNSKSCSELVTQCYKRSFFDDTKVAISTARAGNVIGGGDFSTDRIIPDCVRAQIEKKVIFVRNPTSVRPYQHVLEPLFAYLMIIQKQYEDHKYAGWYNVGPDDCDCVTTGHLVELFCSCWGANAQWQMVNEANAPHEANFLKLDCTKIKSVIGWKPVWHIEEAVSRVCEWTKYWLSNQKVATIMSRQIEEYLNDAK